MSLGFFWFLKEDGRCGGKSPKGLIILGSFYTLREG